MKKRNLVIVLLFACSQLSAQVKKPINILAGGNPVKIQNCKGIIHPVCYDWNNDGKKDLIVGEFTKDSRFRVYLNVGSDKNPKFNDDYFYGKKHDGDFLTVHTG